MYLRISVQSAEELSQYKSPMEIATVGSEWTACGHHAFCEFPRTKLPNMRS